MKVWNVSAETIGHIVSAVSDEKYNGNLIFKRVPERDGRGVRFTLTVQRGADPGGRRSHRGRKVCAACWHCHRDVMRALFTIVPTMRLKSEHADYRGVDEFEDSFEATGDANIGSIMQPLAYRDACECND